jgi:hypothetical protein
VPEVGGRIEKQPDVAPVVASASLHDRYVPVAGVHESAVIASVETEPVHVSTGGVGSTQPVTTATAIESKTIRMPARSSIDVPRLRGENRCRCDLARSGPR